MSTNIYIRLEIEGDHRVALPVVMAALSNAAVKEELAVLTALGGPASTPLEVKAAVVKTWMATPGQRVKVDNIRSPGAADFGTFLGLLLDERGDMTAVVRLDKFGLMLTQVHPSCVTPTTPEEEEDHKP